MKKPDNENSDYGLRGSLDSGGTDKSKIWMQDIFAVIAMGVVFSIFITREFAELMNYQRALGPPLYGNVWLPWEWVIWSIEFDLLKRPSIKEVLSRNGGYLVLCFGAYILFTQYLRRSGQDMHRSLHGSAKFATLKDIRKMDLLDNDGVVLGAWQGRSGKRFVLRHDGPEHVLMVAPTGSGKGVSVVTPTLLTWPHSCVVYDLKKENWALSSRWRKQHADNIVLRFEPACNDGSGASYNPLAEVRLGTDHDIQDVQNISAIIMDYGANTGRSGIEYFAEAAYSLLTAHILHVCYERKLKGKSASLTDVAEALSDPEADFREILERMGNTRHINGEPHPLCRAEASSLLSMLDVGASRQFVGIQDMVRAKLTLYRDPIIRKNITRSDFRIVDLMNHEKPVTLYVCVGSTDKTRLRPLTRLLFSQIVRTLTGEVEYDHGVSTPSYKHKLLLLIDEFPSLGRMVIMNEAIAFLRGYGIKCLFIIQDFTQLRDNEAYGSKESITANCGVRIAFAPNTIATAKELSEMVGTTTIIKREESWSSTPKFLHSPKGNISIREIPRALLTPDEVMRIRSMRKVGKRLIAGDSLVFLVGEPVIYGRQILHFSDPVIGPRSRLGALFRSDALN